jgi:hypothetical protein
LDFMVENNVPALAQQGAGPGAVMQQDRAAKRQARPTVFVSRHFLF